MSTRAIVGYKRTDGTIVGAWCWNDGYEWQRDAEGKHTLYKGA